MKFRLLILLALSLALLTGCMATAEREKGAISVVVTDFPCYDFARAVMGDDAQITLLIKPGAEVHSYDPAPEDIVKMMDADLFVYVGGESDAWADDILNSLGADAPETARMFDCVEALAEETVEGMQAEEEEGAYDEHIWTSPENAALMVRFLADRLSRIDPGNASAYSANADAYIEKIAELDGAFQAVVDSAARREFIFGDRFPFLYFAKRYGLTYYAAFPGCADEAEPSAQTMTFLIDKVISDGVPAIYQIELSSGNIARTIAEETGVEVLLLHSLQNVTADEFAAGETYVTIMRKNVDALRKGLH